MKLFQITTIVVSSFAVLAIPAIASDPVSASSHTTSNPVTANQAVKPSMNRRFAAAQAPARQSPSKSSKTTKVAQRDAIGMPACNNSQWYRNFESGEQALRQRDLANAERYYLGSLSELEKQPKADNDSFFTMRLSMLEQRLSGMYESKLAALSEDNSDKLKVKTEQVQVLQRIATINRRLIPNNILATKSLERSVIASTEHKQLAASLQQKAGSTSENSTTKAN